MHKSISTIGTVASLLFASFSANSNSIPDRPVTVFEPGLVIDDRIGGNIGWVDKYTLIATALIDETSNFWEKKVVAFDVRSGKITELFPQGMLACTNPNEGVFGVHVGSAERHYKGQSSTPSPELGLYKWNSTSNSFAAKPDAAENMWNANICLKTEPADLKQIDIGFLQRDVRYLEQGDGTLNFVWNSDATGKDVVLSRVNKPSVKLDVLPREVGAVPQYMPFRNEYLLSMGVFSMTHTFVRDGVSTQEYPILTMTRSGKIKREFLRPLLESYGFSRDEGTTIPYAQGTLVHVGTRPRSGGGFYLNTGRSLKRIWCINSGNVFDRDCRVVTPISMSPDGCHIAFHSNGSDNMSRPSSYGATLKVIPLCQEKK